MADDPFLSPKLKVERANAHIDELNRVIKAFRDTNPYGYRIEQENGRTVWKLRIRQSIPPMIAAITGDAIQNMRAALDHASCCLAIQRNPSVNINDVRFPIARDAQEFKAAAKKAIKKLSPEARTFIEGLKPYQGGNDQFWRLHRLSVRDRHRVLFPTWAGRSSVGISMVMTHPETGEPFKLPHIFINPADKFEALEDGSVLFASAVPLSGEGGPIDDDVQIRIEIAFGDGEVVEREPIVSTLVQFRDFTKDTLTAIENRFFK